MPHNSLSQSVNNAPPADFWGEPSRMDTWGWRYGPCWLCANNDDSDSALHVYCEIKHCAISCYYGACIAEGVKLQYLKTSDTRLLMFNHCEGLDTKYFSSSYVVRLSLLKFVIWGHCMLRWKILPLPDLGSCLFIIHILPNGGLRTPIGVLVYSQHNISVQTSPYFIRENFIKATLTIRIE